MPKKQPRPIEELEKKVNPLVIKRAKEVARQLDREMKEDKLKLKDNSDKN